MFRLTNENFFQLHSDLNPYSIRHKQVSFDIIGIIAKLIKGL